MSTVQNPAFTKFGNPGQVLPSLQCQPACHADHAFFTQDFTSAVMSVDYSPTGREFVAGGYDRSVRVFAYNGGHSREVYHTKRMQRVMAVAFSGDASHVFSGSDDMNVRVWKVTLKLGLLLRLRPRTCAATRILMAWSVPASTEQRQDMAACPAALTGFCCHAQAKSNEAQTRQLPREMQRQAYNQALIKRYRHLPEVKRIERHRHIPKALYKVRTAYLCRLIA